MPQAKKIFIERLFINSFGVNVEIQVDEESLVEAAKKAVHVALAGRFRWISPLSTQHIFTLRQRRAGRIDLIHNSELKYSNLETPAALERFSSDLRLSVAEFAPEHAFIHAGAVGWKDKGIIFPARSFRGKSSLTAALVRRGARYYSDEYAILDKRGFLHPFPKDLSLRGIKDDFSQVEHSVASLGGRAGSRPIPVKLILITEFQKGAKWRPREMNSGTALLEVLNNSVSIRRNPEFVLPAISLIGYSSRAVKSKRGEADITAPMILDLLDQID